MRALITGGAGFIGSHLADALLAQGHEVLALDDLSTGSTANIAHLDDKKRFRLIEGSILDKPLVENAVAESDWCFHLGAALGVHTILQRPLESLATNIRGSEIVLTAAAERGLKTLVTSTSEIYGKNPKQPLNEDDDRVLGSPLKSRWTYSEAKAIEESMAYELHKSTGSPVVIVRLFNTVGPRQTGRYGMVIPNFVSSALKNMPITVFGDGTQTRVFCHVDDAISGMLALFSNEKANGDVFNIGGQGEISIKDLASQIVERTNSQSSIEYLDYAVAYEQGFEEMHRRVPDTTKASVLTGWQPTRSLNEVIDDVAKFIGLDGRH
ncbi:dTDP-glucose 4,6-dehydratase [mine drainage metagenome]|uniref:dTDP-glucose 4,6-dehydratase n=1 Tax=mine drainage metagenome TaxID=410659 RepID=A0A1J5QCE3_9ZZZZ